MALISAILASVVDGVVNNEEISFGISVMLQAQKLSKHELLELQDYLSKKTLNKLHLLAKSVSVRLTGSSHKLSAMDMLGGIMLQMFIIIVFQISSKIASLCSLLCSKSTDFSYYSQLYWMENFTTFSLCNQKLQKYFIAYVYY